MYLRTWIRLQTRRIVRQRGTIWSTSIDGNSRAVLLERHHRSAPLLEAHSLSIASSAREGGGFGEAGSEFGRIVRIGVDENGDAGIVCHPDELGGGVEFPAFFAQAGGV